MVKCRSPICLRATYSCSLDSKGSGYCANYIVFS